MNKTNKKTTTETINIETSTNDILINYVLIYPNLNDEGKKQVQKELRLIGKNYDLMKRQFNFVSPYKN